MIKRANEALSSAPYTQHASSAAFDGLSILLLLEQRCRATRGNPSLLWVCFAANEICSELCAKPHLTLFTVAALKNGAIWQEQGR